MGVNKSVVLLVILLLAPAVAAWAEWNVRDAGALGDGKADDTAAFQKALDQAGAAGGGVVTVPAGNYCLRGTLRIPGAVTLEGVFRTPPLHVGIPDGGLRGTVLMAYAGRGAPKSEPFIRLAGHAAVLKGVIITYPEWRQTDVPPIPYPPAVQAGPDHVEDVAVIDCLILNAYEGLHFQNAARMIIRNIFGYPSYRGLYIDQCLDISRVENCHFWPFGVRYQPDDPYCKWVNTQGVAFEFGRTDWQYVTHTFCFGYGIGYRFSKTESGSCNGSFVGIGADSCRRGVYVEDAQTAGLLITNGEFVGRWGSNDSVGVEIAETCGAGKVNLSNCSFWGPLDMCVWSRSAKAQLSISNSNFCQWDVNGTGAPAVRLDAGKAVVQGNTFDDYRAHVLVGEDVISAILMGNQGGSGFRCENRAGNRTQRIGNEKPPFEWTDAARANYQIDVGGSGDGLYLVGWYNREKTPGEDEAGSMRWSRSDSRFTLPVKPGSDYAVKLLLSIPEYAISPGNALYFGEERIATLPEAEGDCTITGRFRAAQDTATLTLRVKTWRPSEVNPESGDTRSLGVAVRSVWVQERGQGDRPLFNANTGEYAKP